jgi:hypothetical protein
LLRYTEVVNTSQGDAGFCNHPAHVRASPADENERVVDILPAPEKHVQKVVAEHHDILE